jgi:hypothetical protein
VNSKVNDLIQKGLNSITILVAWSIWNHQNQCVFDGIQPNLNSLLATIREELHQWDLAGARGTSLLCYLVFD